MKWIEGVEERIATLSSKAADHEESIIRLAKALAECRAEAIGRMGQVVDRLEAMGETLDLIAGQKCRGRR